MKIVIFTHPSFLASYSMPLFANMLTEGMKSLGHEVEQWSASPCFYLLPVPRFLKKWLGYIDQYIVFPLVVKVRLCFVTQQTLFVFADQALGPWVSLVCQRPHVIHCHDFLAQRSALGEITENPTSSTGVKYQQFIRWGYRTGKHFISVSQKTQKDLHYFLKAPSPTSEVVYNGLNKNFKVGATEELWNKVESMVGISLRSGYLLHVGGNQWYKNRKGVVALYNAWRSLTTHPLPLILIGPPASAELRFLCENSPYSKDIYLLSSIDDASVLASYSCATVFLFPSLAEGFGWPIAEAMASGCPVITTNEAPMTEVAGDAAFLIPRMPSEPSDQGKWAGECANVIQNVVSLNASDAAVVISKGIANVTRFDPQATIKQIESIYLRILENGDG